MIILEREIQLLGLTHSWMLPKVHSPTVPRQLSGFQGCPDCLQGSETWCNTLSQNTAGFLSSSAATLFGGGFFQVSKSEKVKQMFFQWRFKVCIMNSSLLTTDFLNTMHRNIGTHKLQAQTNKQTN